jgi:hypothetical protein
MKFEARRNPSTSSRTHQESAMGSGRRLVERYPHLPHGTRKGYQIVLTTTNQLSSPATDKYEPVDRSYLFPTVQ